MDFNFIPIGILAVFGIFTSIFFFCENVTYNFEEKIEYYDVFYHKLVNNQGFDPNEKDIFNADIRNTIFAISLFVSSTLVIFGMAFVSF